MSKRRALSALVLSSLTLAACTPPEGGVGPINPGATPSAQPSAESLPQVMLNPVLKGHEATDLTIKDVQGKEHRLSEYKGKFIVLTLFAYWCPHCHKQLPRFEKEVAPLLEGKDVVFIGVEATSGAAEQVISMAAEHKIDQPLYTTDQEALEKAFLPFGFPTSYLISPGFKVHGFIAGESDPKSFADKVTELYAVEPTRDQ